jgi:cytochrome c oxidase assembly protein subunit 11
MKKNKNIKKVKTKKSLKEKNRQMATNVLAIVVGMLCLAYASVPLYDLFCKVTGFGGTTQTAKALPTKILDQEVKVLFNTDINSKLGWEFKPLQSSVKVKIGESALVFFTAENKSNKPTTGVAVYNVTPHQMGAYFNKIQCFCFNNQTLQPGEKITFPVVFFIDPEIINDKEISDISNATLSYSFFEAVK